ncbi:hypothetical protein GUJ93_ZPchr0012g21922 [Zizania palustris]|uniref:TPX2 C-terminal domain-containing protein n=1 Tax=Zizania palustris TaxID=103762 RepID=A0A8J5WR90_ZIZPA|nr:hypothetical protein GUJ93_ZPchr0012g21922 [Zizania palustris]
MATPVRRARGRRPFAVVLAPPSPAVRNRVLSENSMESEVLSFSQCLRRFGKFAARETRPGARDGDGKAVKKCSAASICSPGSRKAASRTPRTGGRRRLGSSSKFSTPAVAPYDAPRAPLWDFSDECEKVRARLSSPYDEVEEGRSGGGVREASRKRTTRSVALEEAMAGLPEPGDGRVKYLVDTFERLLSLSSDPGAQSRGARRRKKTPEVRKTGFSWPPPPTNPEEIGISYPSITSWSEVSFNGGRRSSARDEPRRQRRYFGVGSSEKRRRRMKVIGVTSQHPFNLRTEQRGKVKEENLVQRMKKKLLEEESLRNPLARGLPWTTDEPENPAKPPMKEPTEPIDVVLHSEIRAVVRARFDHQVAERNSFMEKLNMERERQQKLDEEIEIKQLRKEQVPRAHPMPDFSRPFVPKRSQKPQTVPREPRLHPRITRLNPKT